MHGGAPSLARINLNLLQTFLLVAEHRSFRAAADLTHRSQSAVSTQVKQLEDQIGARLFRRTTRSVALTAEAETLMLSVRSALNELDCGIGRIHKSMDSKLGQISVCCSPTIAASSLPAILAKFEKVHPTVGITLHELPSAELFDRVRNGQVDFGIGPVIADERLEFEVLKSDYLFALVPPRLDCNPGNTITLAQLAKLPLLLSTISQSMRQLVEAAFAERELTFELKYQCGQAQTLVAMADAGLGVAILPESVLRKHQTSSVRIVRIAEAGMFREIALVRQKGQVLFPATARLAQLVRESIRTEAPISNAGTRSLRKMVNRPKKSD